MMAVSGADPARWYKQPMVWLVIAIPLSSVIMGVVLITLSLTTDDGLVVDDYYKSGLEINRSLARDRTAAVLGLGADIQFRPDQNTIEVVLSANSGFQPPPQLRLGLYHATRRGFDQQTDLRLATDGVYTGRIAEMVAGRWHVQLATDDWRLIGSAKLPGEKAVRLASDAELVTEVERPH